MTPVLPRRDEPPAALASMASFGLLLTDHELGRLGDWCCDLSGSAPASTSFRASATIAVPSSSPRAGSSAAIRSTYSARDDGHTMGHG